MTSRAEQSAAALADRVAQFWTRTAVRRDAASAERSPVVAAKAARTIMEEAERQLVPVVRPLVARLASDKTLPPEVRAIFEHLAGPKGQAGVLVLSQFIAYAAGLASGPVLSPFLEVLRQQMWQSVTSATLDPGTAAQAYVQGFMPLARAEDEASRSGVNEERFGMLTALARQRLTVDLVLESARRGNLTHAEAVSRLEHLGYDPDNAALLVELRVQIPSPDEALQGLLQGQISEAEARRWYEAAGGDPKVFMDRFHIRGQAPTPTQLQDAANRGLIPWSGDEGPEGVSFLQGFLEGPERNKWEPVMAELATYVVPPRSVVPMVRSGAWSKDRGVQELQKSGVPVDTARAMIEEAASGKLAAEKDLVKSEVIAAYREGLMRADEAASSLVSLGYDPDEADLLLAIADHQWDLAYRNAAINRLRALYVKGSITEDEASSALAALGAGGKALSKLLAMWDVERELPRAQLSEAQMRAALRAGLVTEAEYRSYLSVLGYDPREVEILTGLAAPK